MQNLNKQSLKTSNGITLIALVITIIVLLILAGISIGMLSGDNGILGQAGNAKTQTDIAEEKEIIDLAVVHAMGKSKYGDIDETSFTNELEKNNATVTKSGSKYKVAFSSGRQYTVDQDGNVKEKKVNPNALEIYELNENAETYFGWDVINYAETLDSSLNYLEWQLFYAGALEGETEERIYLISKDYVKNTDLPTVIKNGVKVSGAKPIAIDGSNYKAKFSTNNSTPNDGVLPHYAGSTSITNTIAQKMNSKFFKYLTDNSVTSSYSNIKAVAYMQDTTTWGDFAGSYADYAMGGPTVEMLFKAYNQYKKKENGSNYEAQVTRLNGYQISKNGGTNWSVTGYSDMIEEDTSSVNSPYIVSSNTNADAYWLASPSDNKQTERNTCSL